MTNKAKTMVEWETALNDYSSIFNDEFLDHWSSRPRHPTEEDGKAAAELHVQLISRVATQNLLYRAGVEAAALKSIYQLFEFAREIGTKYPLARDFDDLVWYVLNEHVRPFTAKWHRKNQSGVLEALDETDQFRSELSQLQAKLVDFDSLLLLLRDGENHNRFSHSGASSAIEKEMERPLAFGIPLLRGEASSSVGQMINDAEKAAVTERRENYCLEDAREATGMAISGGGIRSATFALGVLVAFSKRNLLPQFDYLSTVSGGGFVGSFLTAFLSGKGDGLGLKKCQQPFNFSTGESPALRRIRHKSRYLQTSIWERLSLAVAQVHGMAVNIFAISLVPLLVALLEHFGRNSKLALDTPGQTSMLLVVTLIAGLVVPGISQRVFKTTTFTEHIFLMLAAAMTVFAMMFLLGSAHNFVARHLEQQSASSAFTYILAAAFVPFLSTLMFSILPARQKIWRKALALVAGLSAPLCFLVVELMAFAWLESDKSTTRIYVWDIHFNSLLLSGVCFLIYALVWLPLDVNFTSPHGYYRRKLAQAFIVQKTKSDELEPVDISLSATSSDRGPYHLINAALNVPSSANPAMQGRLADFFIFSKSFCGSPITGYHPTEGWERANPKLSLATAMAISGAAASPMMGLETKAHVSFWMAMLNVRLGYWLKNPMVKSRSKAPGALQLGREMLNRIDEHGPFLNLTDGGHIENLGVYELLRRRCKFIVAIDGEFDPNMTFHALTNLQRLAFIDFGISIDIDLDELRLDAKQLSRSHFKLCRINYPPVDNIGGGIGYLLYIKLSLTGNEGEFIRRYKMDEPEFPHHSTANQFFSETQFEAYRSLGEHIGEKLFTEALSGTIGNEPQIKGWFKELGKRMLEHTGQEPIQ